MYKYAKIKRRVLKDYLAEKDFELEIKKGKIWNLDAIIVLVKRFPKEEKWSLSMKKLGTITWIGGTDKSIIVVVDYPVTIGDKVPMAFYFVKNRKDYAKVKAKFGEGKWY